MSWLKKQIPTGLADKSRLRQPQNGCERFFFDMIGNDSLRSVFLEIVSNKDKTLGEIIAEMSEQGYEVEVLDFVAVAKGVNFEYDDDSLRRFFKT